MTVAPILSRFARVAITDVTVGLTKADGRPWDGFGTSITPEDTAALATALGVADPIVAVAAVLTRPTVQAIDKPEVKGTATLFLGAVSQAPQKFGAHRDTMRPMLLPSPVWSHVPLDGTARIQVDAIDGDVFFDDPIATFIITGADLVEAVRRGNIYQVKVADQTGRSILFAGLSVIPE